ncbi:MAG: squalene/phytoene synthase family protein [Gemmatimonadota bacterium]
MNAILTESYARAERVTAEWAKSFHFASRFLPVEKKLAIFALYDFCRHADNLVDERGARPVDEVRLDLANLDAMLLHLHAVGTPPERWLALGDTLSRYPIPVEPLRELLVGVAMDLEPVVIETLEELLVYCTRVAGGVGLMLGPVLGAPSSEFNAPGVRLGIAMQLTNILRDIGEDLGRNRVYLPAEELDRFGLDRADLERRTVTPAFIAFMRFQVARAREYFAAGDEVIGLFPRDGSRLTVRLLQQTYAGILDVIEAQEYDVFRRRAYTSRRRKMRILARAFWHEHIVSPSTT